MPVIKLCGEEWDLSEKIVMSVDEKKSFQMQITTIMKKLGVENFTGMCLYRTEGSGRGGCPVHPTVPIPMNSNMMKEKLGNGAILYVKQADLQAQARDVELFESLQQFRKEHQISAIRSDGSDIAEFEQYMMNTLGAKASKDIDEFEQEKRKGIDIQEFRELHDITFEYRQVKGLKDEEAMARDELFNSISRQLAEHYKTLILNPRFQEGSRIIFQEEIQERKNTESEETSNFLSNIRQVEVKQRTKLELRLKGKEKEVSIDEAEEAARKSSSAAPMLIGSPQQFNVGVGMSQEEYEKLTNMMKENRTEVNLMMASMDDKLMSSLKQFQAVLSQEAVQTKELVTVMLSEHNQAVSRMANVTKRNTDEAAQERIARLEYTLKHELPAQQQFFLSDIDAGAEDVKEIERLLQEQNKLLEVQKKLQDEEEIRNVEKDGKEEQDVQTAIMSSLQQVQTQMQVIVEEVMYSQERIVSEKEEWRELVQSAHQHADQGRREDDMASPSSSPLRSAAWALRDKKHQQKIVEFKVPYHTLRPLPKEGPLGIDRMFQIENAALYYHPDVFEVIVLFVEQFVPLAPIQDRNGEEEDDDDEFSSLDDFTKYSLSFDGQRYKKKKRMNKASKEEGETEILAYPKQGSGSPGIPANNSSAVALLRYPFGGNTESSSTSLQQHQNQKLSNILQGTKLEVLDFVLDLCCHLRSPWAVSDYLCLHCKVSHDVELRRQLLRAAESTKPYLVCVLDLLMELYHGREAELGVALVSSGLKEKLSESLLEKQTQAALKQRLIRKEKRKNAKLRKSQLGRVARMEPCHISSSDEDSETEEDEKDVEEIQIEEELKLIKIQMGKLKKQKREEFVMHWDENSGIYYYHHTKLNIVQWLRPHCFD